MCGIFGKFGSIDAIERINFLENKKNISSQLSRRGPNQQNIFETKNFISTHSRLIVQGGRDDGLQPMRFNNVILLFNGNLYNKQALTKELVSKGYKFDGISDTEVVAKSIHYWKHLAFKKFNGFFSIAYFDELTNKLILARDRFGQKPMYFATTNSSVCFGSTESFIPREYCGDIRNESIIDFITFGFIPSPNTMFNNLFSVHPGSYIEFSIKNGSVFQSSSKKYWMPEITNEIDDAYEAKKLISDSLDKSIREGMDASIDVACLFSGGVDSSLILSKSREINKEIFAITANFGQKDDAAERSTSLANVLGHENHIIKNISKDDVNNSLSSISTICDSPFDDTSLIPSNIVFSTVKNSGYSVALTGDGADELFCGYSSFGNLKKLEPFLNSKLDNFFRLPFRHPSKVLSNFLKVDLNRFFMNEDDLLRDLLCNGFKKREWQSEINTDYDPFHYFDKILTDKEHLRPLDKLRILNLEFKLPYQMLYKVDRASMFNSVEARPIFLNNRIVDASLKISSSAMLQNGQKSVLKDVYQSQINHSGWNLPKSGFGWKTDSYEDIFTNADNNALFSMTGIDGLALLKNRKRHHKRGYYGLYSLVSWLKKNTTKIDNKFNFK